MKRKIMRIIALTCVISTLLFSSGCGSFNFFSVESLLAPPSLSGKNGEVQEAFNKLVNGKNIKLKTPSKGDYKSSFVLYDIDSGGEDEALVFYTDTAIDSSVRMAVLECVNDVWVLSADIKGTGSGVYDVSFCDLDGDGNTEIFVSWTLLDDKTTRMISVYGCVRGENGILNFLTLGSEYCNAMTFCDFNSDGQDDLVLVYLDDSGAVQNSYLRIFSIGSGGSLIKYSETLLDSSVSQVSAIMFDSVKVKNTEFRRLFIECAKNDTSMFTEAVIWNPRTLKAKRIFADAASSTLRSSKISVRDIDGDSNLEIPVNIPFEGDPEYMTATVGENVYTFSLIEWKNITGDKSEGQLYTVFDPMNLYLMRFTWNDKVTVRYDVARAALVFCKWDADNKVITDELFSIARYQPGDELLFENMTKLTETKDGDYYYAVTSYGYDFGITDETVLSGFIKL